MVFLREVFHTFKSLKVCLFEFRKDLVEALIEKAYLLQASLALQFDSLLEKRTHYIDRDWETFNDLKV